MTSPERKFHGCWLAHPAWFSSVATLFDARDFNDAADKKLWEVASALHSEGHQPAPLDALAALSEVEGGGDAVRELVALKDLCSTETRSSFDRRVDALIAKSQAKRTKRLAQRLVAAVDEGVETDWPATFIKAGEKLRALDKRAQHHKPITFARFMEAASSKRRRTIIPTGWPDIDRYVLGQTEGEVLCVCSRTNAGKSTFLASLALNQFFARAALHPEGLHAASPESDPYTLRREPAHAYYKDERSGAEAGTRAPWVLVLTVEDTIDDYLSRFVCNLCDVDGRDFRLDPERAIGQENRGEALEAIARAFTQDGRLTIADYESEEGSEDKTLAQIESTILGWVSLVTEQAHARGEERPPLLVLLDYFQKTELPEEEGKHSPEVQLLKRASKRLHALAKKQKFALTLAVMLLRGHDSVAPDHNDARGGSDVIQDMETVISLWPFGPSELAALENAAREVAQDEPEDSFEAVIDDDVAAALAPRPNDYDEDFIAPIPLTSKTLRAAARELVITGHKGRHGGAGWQVPLEFNRPYKRITSSVDPKKIYRRDPNVQRLLKEHRKISGQEKKR